MWIDPTSSDANETLLYFGSSANTYMKLAGRDANGYAHLTISVGGTVQQLVSTVQIPLNRWTNLALTMGGGTATFYVNGSAAGSAAISYRPTDVLSADTDQSADSLYVGRDATGNYFTGRMVDVRFYNVAIAPAEVVNEMLRSGPKLGVFYAAAPVNFSNTELESGVHSGYTRTLSAWINPRSAVNTGGYFSPVIDSRDENNNGGSWEGNGFGVNNGHIVVMLDNTGIWDTGVSVRLNQWQHVTVTLSGTTAKLFVNGVQRATRTYSANTSVLPAKNYRIGWGYSGTANTHFDGQIFDLEISDKVVAPTAAAAPTVASAPAAIVTSPATVNLSVLGADNSGESNLTYTWVASGPGTAKFSANGANAAKNTSTTFSQSGAYLFTVLITNATGQSVTASVTVTASQVFGGVAPATCSVLGGGTQQFTAVDQFGQPMPGSVTWSTSVGTITSAGLYTAPAIGTASTVTASIAAAGSQSANVTIVSPLAWYQNDATSGSTVADSSDHGYNGAASGSFSWTTGEISRALTLSGGYATLPNNIVNSLTNFTISAWVKLTSIGNWARLFDFGTGTNVNMFLAPADGSGYVRFAITTGGSGAEQRLTTTTALATNTWTFLTVTLSGTTGTLYINGAAAATNIAMTLNPSSLGNTTQNYLGKSQYGDPMLQGSIDDFRIYGAAASAATIAAMYNTGLNAAGHIPTVATPAAALPSPATGVTTILSALGAESAGESNLTYTWTTTGTPPAPVVFSSNGNNAAKSTTAAFTKAGAYSFKVTIGDPLGYSVTSNASVTVNQTPQSVSISPAAANITAGSTEQFTLVGQDQFGQAYTITDPVSWQLTGPGSLGASSGLYVPPYASGSATVQATYGALSIAPATVTFSGQAQWNAATSASWNAAGSWKDSISSSTIAAPGTRGVAGDTVVFAAATGAIARLDGANPTLAGITFNYAATSYTIAQVAGGSLTLQGSGGALVSVLAGSHTISAPVHLASPTAVSTAPASGLTISGPIDGSGGVTLTGGGTLTLSGSNTCTGPTQVNGGTLIVISPAALPDGSSLSVGADAASFFNGMPALAPATAAAPWPPQRVEAHNAVLTAMGPALPPVRRIYFPVVSRQFHDHPVVGQLHAGW